MVAGLGTCAAADATTRFVIAAAQAAITFVGGWISASRATLPCKNTTPGTSRRARDPPWHVEESAGCPTIKATKLFHAT